MNNLKILRTEKHLTIRELSDKVGISHSTICHLENEIRPFTLDHLERLSKFFDCSFEYIQGKSDERKPTVTKVIIPSNEDITVAFFEQRGIVTEDQKKQVEQFIQFLKTQESNNG